MEYFAFVKIGVTILAKHSILDVWLGSDNASDKKKRH